MGAVPFDWASYPADMAEGQRMEHSFSVNARHQAAIRYAENVLYPALELCVVDLGVAVTSARAEHMLTALRRLQNVGLLAGFEAEKLDGRPS